METRLVSTPKQGIITKIHSNYYYVDFETNTWECMLRNKLKKEGTDPKVGDKVYIDSLNYENLTGVITFVLERKNELDKPNIANIDQIIIVSSTYSPDFNPLQLDKFIVLSESYNMTPVICINKCDHLDIELKEYIEETYKNTGYKIIYTSSLTKEGIDDLKSLIPEKISVLTGVSGSGKSSIINCIDPHLKLETGEVSKLSGTGKHTTRHVSLQKVVYNNKLGFLADTPGFNFLEFTNISSSELAWYFKEFVPFIPDCKMSSCLHREEPNCKVKENIDTESPRYLNYLFILKDILEIEKQNKTRSLKKETQVKITQRSDGKNIRVVKLGTQSKEGSRRTKNQQIKNMEKINSFEEFEEEY